MARPTNALVVLRLHFAEQKRGLSSKTTNHIGFETPTPSLHTSMTDGIEFSKLRKSNQRFAFLKFTYFVPRNNILANI